MERAFIRAKLHPARNFRNPGAFDYEGYLRENGISMLGSAQMADVERLTRIFRQPHRALARPHSCQHHPQNSRALARRSKQS